MEDLLKNPIVYNCFTDGSAVRSNPGLAGAAAILIINDEKKEFVDKSYSFQTHQSNNVAELKGIDLALDLLEAQKKETRTQWHIWSDNEYVIGMLSANSKWVAKANIKIIEHLRNRLQKLRSSSPGLAIEFHWVKSHAGHYWNEKVDKLARKAAGF